MSNKTQLQQNNIDLQEILTEISNLPNKKDAQTGLYVWEKTAQSTVDNPSIQIQTTGATTLVSSDVVDLEKVNEQFFDGFGFTSMPQDYYFQYSDGVLYYKTSNASTAINYDPITKTFDKATGSGQFSYSGTKNVYQGQKAYVVNDNAEEYPENSSQDGFWYKKISDEYIASNLGVSKFETGSILFSFDTNLKSAAINITHSLGMMPFVFLIYTPSTGLKNNTIKSCLLTKDANQQLTNSNIGYFYISSSSRPVLSKSDNLAEMTEQKITLPSTTSFNETGVFEAGITYRWIAMA